jgi:hypothetical protein
MTAPISTATYVLTSTGHISILDIQNAVVNDPNSEFYGVFTPGQTGTAYGGLDWVQNQTKASARNPDLGFTPSICGPSDCVFYGNINLNWYHNYAYYTKVDGTGANNTNCTNTGANCGDHNCVDCYTTNLADCTNADTRNWLQPNCNCACVYNCNSNQWSINCNCDCPWICNCACW